MWNNNKKENLRQAVHFLAWSAIFFQTGISSGVFSIVATFKRSHSYLVYYVGNELRFLLELEVLTLHIITLIKMENGIKNQLKNK